ncbi:MAG TPA: cob(I)yrinic acid a,c-diamide adenosyltransferase, partial [Nitrospinota bacterium]|nr:cob(I)yrinic acid a,c-diamide adenosyltransferase [Nitrospinota bacterium]
LEAWDLCRKKIESKEYDMVIMDEINYAIHYNLLNLDDVISFLKNKPKKIHIVLTGRNAKPELIEIADIVTEMRDIKHSYRRGMKAQKGIEY